MRVRAAASVLFCSLFISASSGNAQERAGLILQFNGGPGYGATWTSQAENDYVITGLAGTGSLSLGGFLSPKLVLFGEFVATVLSDPTFELNGQESPPSSDASVSTAGAGAGLGYYLADTWYVEGTLLLSWLTMEQDGQVIAETDPGFGLKVLLGKKWPISDRVALGASAHGNFALMKDKGENAPTWKSLSGGLDFSVTWIPKGGMRTERK